MINDGCQRRPQAALGRGWSGREVPQLGTSGLMLREVASSSALNAVCYAGRGEP
jgi:hypothetical protein